MATMKKKGMGKPMKKAEFGIQTAKKKKAPAYEDDMNDRLMADAYVKYEQERIAREKAKAKAKPAPKPVAKPTKGVGIMKKGGKIPKKK